MKNTARSFPALIAILTLIGLSGCASTRNDEGASAKEPPVTESAKAGASDATGKPASAESGSVAAAAQGASATQQTLQSIGAPSQRSAYFDYDRYDIREEFKAAVSDHAKFLVARKDAKMLIQGNADERGSREYNLALGQRRADAVKRLLLLQGVREEQIESVSLGEEKPKASGHDEASWAENRRADMLYKGEY